jgi:hypothetical protein
VTFVDPDTIFPPLAGSLAAGEQRIPEWFKAGLMRGGEADVTARRLFDARHSGSLGP